MLATLATWITGLISAGGYAGIAFWMALESACTPVPSELVMPFAGYLASSGRFTLWGAALAGAIGCNIGSTVAYAAGAWGGRPFIARWGRFVLLDAGHMAATERFFARFGTGAVLLGRVLPVVRTFIALPAGIGHMRQLPFQVYTFVGSFVWCYVLAYVGEQLGQHWDSDPRLRAVMHSADAIVVVVVLAALGWFVWRRRRRAASDRRRPGVGPIA